MQLSESKVPFYGELKGLFPKTVRAFGEIKEDLEGIEGIETAFFYGSDAKGGGISGFDMDLLIVGTIDEDKGVENIPSLGRRLGREINYSIYGVEELRKKKKEGNGFINGVLKEFTLVLLGNPDELCEKFNREGCKATRTVFQ